jgi:hypothetical protein
MDTFGWGVADRGKSIRVGRMVPVEKCGYYEVRRGGAEGGRERGVAAFLFMGGGGTAACEASEWVFMRRPPCTCGHQPARPPHAQDRRPASNLDPYVVTRLICESALLM